MRVASHPEAEQELEAAALWYEERQPGLGDDFLEEFEHTLRRIEAEPERWRVFQGGNRKLNFPTPLFTASGPTPFTSKP
jgi:galactose-1-phosphate uridylyltransferase